MIGDSQDEAARQRRSRHEQLLERCKEKPHLRSFVPPCDGQPLWVFGYGSLMWNPGFPHAEARVGVLHGYHRRFCIYSHRYRGTPERPGLVLGLDRGGECRGMVFAVMPEQRGEVVAYLHDREMVTHVYRPTFLPVETEHGRVRALCFVVDQGHEQYTGRLTLEETADYIVDAAGQRGPCSEYLGNTVKRLEDIGVGAGDLADLYRLVDRRCRDRQKD